MQSKHTLLISSACFILICLSPNLHSMTQFGNRGVLKTRPQLSQGVRVEVKVTKN